MKKDKLEQILSNNPTLILIGEAHTDYDHVRQESEIIKRFKPDYLLLEGIDSNEVKDLPLRLDHDFDVTLKSLYSELKTGLYAEFAHNLYSTYKSLTEEHRGLRYFYNIDEKTGHSLDGFFKNIQSFEEFLSKPLLLFPSLILKEVQKAAYKSNETSVETRQALNRITKEAEQLEKVVLANPYHCFVAAIEANPAMRVYGIDLHNCYDHNLREDNMAKIIADVSINAELEGKKALAIVGMAHIRDDSAILLYLESVGVKYEKLPLYHKDDIMDYYYSLEYNKKAKNQDKNEY